MLNRYVVIIPEDYDVYTVDVPHPIETELTRDDLIDEMRAFFETTLEVPYFLPDGTWHFRPYQVQDWQLDLGGMGFMVRPDQISHSYRTIPGDNHSYTDDFRPLEILTVDEWFSSTDDDV